MTAPGYCAERSIYRSRVNYPTAPSARSVHGPPVVFPVGCGFVKGLVCGAGVAGAIAGLCRCVRRHGRGRVLRLHCHLVGRAGVRRMRGLHPDEVPSGRFWLRRRWRRGRLGTAVL